MPFITTPRVKLAILPDGILGLDYELSGELGRLRIPSPASTERTDGLWRQTCFELFVSGADWPAYREFNFSPSGQWQAYAFRAYREGGLLEPASIPDIATESRSERLIARVRLTLDNLPPGDRLRIGLCAVLEGRDGVPSYWALRHPPGKPDFHHPDTFALELDIRNPQP